ncbi:MAG: response regulator transcription factor [Alphaproteobacteria bacterium]|nr:response regulator transcription factor [Alphaproteobacteria bacterium]
MRLLVIEDHQRLAEFIAAGLEQAGFAVDAVHSAADGEAAIGAVAYDAVILDLGLPDADGLTLLKARRARGDTVPILLLTARDDVEHRVEGLDAGADDYLLKPFAMAELVARIRVLLRRPSSSLGVVLTEGNLRFDTVGRQATVNGDQVMLSRREIDLLELLMRRSGRVVSKSAIEEGIYAFGEELASNAVEVLVHRLRKRMLRAGATVQLHTLRGVGYLLSDKVP